jgi:hypothetical protein
MLASRITIWRCTAPISSHNRAADGASVWFAVERLGAVIYRDTDMTDALRAIATSGPADPRDAAREALRHGEGA